jgi:hypothetical protein
MFCDTEFDTHLKIIDIISIIGIISITTIIRIRSIIVNYTGSYYNIIGIICIIDITFSAWVSISNSGEGGGVGPVRPEGGGGIHMSAR